MSLERFAEISGQLYVDGSPVDEATFLAEIGADPEVQAATALSALIDNATALRDGLKAMIVDTDVADRDPAVIASAETDANALLEASLGIEDATLTNLVSEITALSLRGTRERIAYDAGGN